MRWVVVALVAGLVGLAGCSEGADSTAPEGGELTGGADPTESLEGEGSGDVVWVDAEGQVVDSVVWMDGLKYVDEDGYFWPLDPWGSGEEAFLPNDIRDLEALWQDSAVEQLYFADAGCAEPLLYAPGVAPRQVVMTLYPPGTMVTDAFNGRTWVLAEDAEPARPDPVFNGLGSSCIEQRGGELVYGGGDLLEVAPPPTDWLPPLHPEYR